jgi:YihY family inner membrane protein
MAGIPPFLRQWLRTAHGALRIFGEIEGEARAASFAYYALFSLIPLFTLVLTVGSVFVAPQDVIGTVERFFPMESGQQAFVWNMSESLQRARGGVGVVSFLVLAWASLRFFQALVQGVNRAWHHELLPWWKLPAKNLAMMVVLASAVGLGLFAPAALQAVSKILKALEEMLAVVAPGMRFDAVSVALGAGRYVLAGGLMFYALTALYMLAPGMRIYFRQVWLAALCVTIALQAGQSVFGNYVAKIVNYHAIYGSVGALMLTLMWVYIAGALILLGSCFCAAAAQGEEA